MPVLCIVALTAVLAAGCSPSAEDHARQLAGNSEAREAARQELLLAKERAVAPLLEVLKDPELASARGEVVDVLAGLMTRIDAPEISAALIHHLQTDDSADIRARIARHLGLQRHLPAATALVQALDDDHGEVRYQAMLALGRLESRLADEVNVEVRRRSRELQGDADVRVREEAMMVLAGEVTELIRQAQKATLEGRLEEAESLFLQAIEASPASKRAQHRLGRFYYDNGQPQRGLDLLRTQGMLLDIPRLSRAPRVDGDLHDEVWREAAVAEGFYAFSREHDAALVSRVQTHVRIGYTQEALYLAYDCVDADTDSLVVGRRDEVWFDDDVEFYFDANFDHHTYCQVGMNSIGTVNSHCFEGGLHAEVEWSAEGDVGVHVAEGRWTVEYRLPLGTDDAPVPAPGDLWGFNLIRVFRGAEYAQWTRTYGQNAHQPDEFGVLRFR